MRIKLLDFISRCHSLPSSLLWSPLAGKLRPCSCWRSVQPIRAGKLECAVVVVINQAYSSQLQIWRDSSSNQITSIFRRSKRCYGLISLFYSRLKFCFRSRNEVCHYCSFFLFRAEQRVFAPRGLTICRLTECFHVPSVDSSVSPFSNSIFLIPFTFPPLISSMWWIWLRGQKDTNHTG